MSQNQSKKEIELLCLTCKNCECITTNFYREFHHEYLAGIYCKEVGDIVFPAISCAEYTPSNSIKSEPDVICHIEDLKEGSQEWINHQHNLHVKTEEETKR